MADIATVWDVANQRGDWALAPPDLLSGQDLETAVLISLFTDRAADPGDIPPGAPKDTDPRGWWGDTGETYMIGSKLWLRYRSKMSDQTAALIKSDIVQALQWLIDDGVVASVVVTVVRQGLDLIAVKIVIRRPNGPVATFEYDWAWATVN